jgi:hypothetical protein
MREKKRSVGNTVLAIPVAKQREAKENRKS